MTTLTADDVLGDIAWAVAQRGPGYRSDGKRLADGMRRCSYAEAGAPSCIFGLILAERYGVPVALLDDMDATRGSIETWLATPLAQLGPATAEVARRLRTYVAASSDPATVRLLADVQDSQDFGIPYGELLAPALRTHPA